MTPSLVLFIAGLAALLTFACQLAYNRWAHWLELLFLPELAFVAVSGGLIFYNQILPTILKTIATGN